MIQALYKTIGLIAALIFSSAFLAGCGNEEPDTSAEAAEEINFSDNGLMKAAEGRERRIISKYLTPRYLATAEAESRGYGKNMRDSLIELYSRTMSFHIAIADRQGGRPDPEVIRDRNSGILPGGIMDIEAERNLFSLQCGDSLWAPVVALPESRLGEAEQVWFVVFAVDPGKLSGLRSRAVVTYTPPDGTDAVRFTYNVEDFLRPEFIASTK